MGFEFSHCSLDSKEIKARVFSGLTYDEFVQRINAFVHFIAIEMNNSYFSVIEAFLRQIHREIIADPPGSFSELTKSISDTLGLQQWSQSLNFYRLVRNTQHNNGLFFPNKKEDVEVLYRDETFSFIYGKENKFAPRALHLSPRQDRGVLRRKKPKTARYADFKNTNYNAPRGKTTGNRKFNF